MKSEYVRYGTPIHDNRGVFWVDNELEARQFAAGNRGDGSGTITKKTVCYELINKPPVCTEIDTKIQETLEPVTKFTTEGQKRRDKFIADRDCKHKKLGAWIMQGGGCHKDYEKRCIDCGKAVDFQ